MGFVKSGACLCGEITYRIVDRPLFTHACHCTNCHKLTGTSCWLSMFVLKRDFELLSGSPGLSHPPMQFGTANRFFCTDCGCTVYATHSMFEKIIFPVPGTFEDMDWFAPQAHIYVKSKLSWVHLSDGAPQFQENYNIEEVWPKESLVRLHAA